jgi:hypothetical protein
MNLKKDIIFYLFRIASFSAHAKKKPPLYSFSLGIESGFFSTIGVSGQQQFNSNTFIFVSAGHRIPGGLLRNSNQNTRTGGIGFGMKTLPLIEKRRVPVLSLFIGLGGYGSIVNYFQSTRAYNTDFGATAGGGLLFNWKSLQLTLRMMPGYELSASPSESPQRFQLFKCTGINLAFKLF